MAINGSSVLTGNGLYQQTVPNQNVVKVTSGSYLPATVTNPSFFNSSYNPLDWNYSSLLPKYDDGSLNIMGQGGLVQGLGTLAQGIGGIWQGMLSKKALGLTRDALNAHNALQRANFNAQRLDYKRGLDNAFNTAYYLAGNPNTVYGNQEKADQVYQNGKAKTDQYVPNPL